MEISNLKLEKALTLPGWLSEIEMRFLAQLASKSYRIAEIGSWRGRSARAFADNMLGILTCVDHWKDDAYGNPGPWNEIDGPDFCKQQDWLWNDFHKNLADHIKKLKVLPLRMNSVDAARLVQNIQYDVIFIDAGHSYQDVCSDILAWKPLLAPNGFFLGHDYNQNSNPEVVQAVDELVGKVETVGTIWVAR